MFQKLSFYNVLIEKPHFKRVKNIDLQHELPFYGKVKWYNTLVFQKYQKHLKDMQEVIKLK